MRTRTPRIPCVLAALLLFAAAPTGGPARGQGHPLPRLARPLDARLQEADAVGFATVREVDAGRYRFEDAHRLRGELPAAFEAKRAPSHPLPLEPGDRALLLLRGARSPYLVIDEARELVEPAGREQEDRLAAALDALMAAPEGGRGPVYAAWLDGEDATLRGLALVALSQPGARGSGGLPEAFYADQGARAWDRTRSLPARRASAQLASLSPEGLVRLAEGALPCDPGADPEVLLLALRATSVGRLPQLDAVAACASAHDDAGVRDAAARMAERARR